MSVSYAGEVLIVDDELTLMEPFKEVLTEEGHSVSTASNGLEAIRLLEEKEFEVALVDLVLPDIDGYNLLREIKKIDPNTEVIIVTGHGSVDSIVETVKAGAFDYIVKGTGLERVIVAVKNAIIKHRLTVERDRLRQDLQRVNEKKREFFELAIRDGLTNLYNHRFFREQLEREMNKGPLSIVMFDADNFKGYNDTHGHLKGDEVLRQMAEVLESTVRDTDIVARYGGDEFFVILPDTDKSSAAKFAQRCVRLIAEYHFEGEELIPSGKITISAGVASYPDDATNSALLIDNADNACYRAKETGKNGVYICKGMDFERLSN